jgi:hypothetical protein
MKAAPRTVFLLMSRTAGKSRGLKPDAAAIVVWPFAMLGICPCPSR